MTTPRKFTKAERRILQVLASKPGATSQEVHEAADLHRTYALRVMKRMAAEVLIVPTMIIPTYELSPQGQHVLDSLTKP